MSAFEAKEFRQHLETICSADPETAYGCLKTVNTLIQNVMKHLEDTPEHEKFKKVNLTNKRIASEVCGVSGGEAALRSFGFQAVDETPSQLVLSKNVTHEHMNTCWQEIGRCVENMDEIMKKLAEQKGSQSSTVDKLHQNRLSRTSKILCSQARASSLIGSSDGHTVEDDEVPHWADKADGVPQWADKHGLLNGEVKRAPQRNSRTVYFVNDKAYRSKKREEGERMTVLKLKVYAAIIQMATYGAVWAVKRWVRYALMSWYLRMWKNRITQRTLDLNAPILQETIRDVAQMAGTAAQDSFLAYAWAATSVQKILLQIWPDTEVEMLAHGRLV